MFDSKSIEYLTYALYGQNNDNNNANSCDAAQNYDRDYGCNGDVVTDGIRNTNFFYRGCVVE